MKHPFLLTIFIVLHSLALSAQEKSLNSQLSTLSFLTDGVSWQLAQHRKSTIKDLHYSISFSIPEEKTADVEGEETISFAVDSRDDIIIDFREVKDKIHSVKANGKVCRYQFENEHIIVPRKYIRKGQNAINIVFTAGNQSLNRRDGYVYTLFVPDRARTVFPCFEQPNLKAKFTLALTVPAAWSAVTNTPEADGNFRNSEVPRFRNSESNVKTIRFSESEPLPTYLFAFAAGKFQHQTFTQNGRTIGAFYRETDPKRIAQLPDIARQVFFSLDWQEAFTGVKYPFNKYDFVVLPGFQFGGMEHTGATFYNDNTLFLPENPTPDEQLKRTELISHETSHMWFGDAVTMNWFDDVWTKEVFANYFAAEITAPLFPELDHELNWLRTYQGAAISQDRTEGRTSIRQPLDNMRYAGLIYNNIIYNKAPVMMRKMVNLMGKEAYQRGIQKYVEKFKYGNATWDDLIEILDAETPADLKTFSKEWVDTAKWPTRKAGSFADAYDTDYYGYTELSSSQTDSLMSSFPKGGAQSMAAMMTLYENYLNKTIPADRFFALMLNMTGSDNPLTCSSAIGYMSEPLRELQTTHSAQEMEPYEQQVWSISKTHALPSVRTQALRLLISRAVSSSIVDSLYTIWQHQPSENTSHQTPSLREGWGRLLSINDYMSLACELSIHFPGKANEIISTQRSRIKNPDRLAQFDYIARSVNPSESARDSLFASLSKPENRRIEPWTLSVIYYLNHPLRDKQSVKYIHPALELLPDVQRTGDIFFPGNWCSYLLSGHRSPEAYREVETFLAEHPDMLGLLKNKVLQGEYYLKRMISDN